MDFEVSPMSSPPLPSDWPSTTRWSPAGRRLNRLVASVRSLAPDPGATLETVVRPARAVAFWGAVALPFLNLGLLVHGLSNPAETFAFLVLLAANVVALLVGHPHRRG